MSVYLSSQKIIKDWIDYNDHMNVSYYLLIFDKYGADTLNQILPTIKSSKLMMRLTSI